MAPAHRGVQFQWRDIPGRVGLFDQHAHGSRHGRKRCCFRQTHALTLAGLFRPGRLAENRPRHAALAASNGYTGTTLVSAALQIGPGGSLSAASAISVSNSSTLAVTASTNLPGNTITVNPAAYRRHRGRQQFLAHGRQPVDDRPAQRRGHRHQRQPRAWRRHAQHRRHGNRGHAHGGRRADAGRRGL